MIGLHDQVVTNDDVLSTDVDGDVVMMDVDSGNYFGLDAISSDIWHRLARPVTVEALCDDLLRDYDAPLDVIRRDVLALLNTLHDKKLVRTVA